MDCSPPSSSVHGILQARILEQAAIPFSRESFQLRDQIWVSRIAGSFFTIWATREAWLQHDTLCHITLLSSCLKRWDCSPALFLNSHVTRFAGAMWPQAWIILVLSKHFPVWKMLRHWFWKEDVLQVRQSQPLWTIHVPSTLDLFSFFVPDTNGLWYGGGDAAPAHGINWISHISS